MILIIKVSSTITMALQTSQLSSPLNINNNNKYNNNYNNNLDLHGNQEKITIIEREKNNSHVPGVCDLPDPIQLLRRRQESQRPHRAGLPPGRALGGR